LQGKAGSRRGEEHRDDHDAEDGNRLSHVDGLPRVKGAR
jgi:hypothetical protein